VFFVIPVFLVQDDVRVGLGMMVQMASGNTILQTIVEESKRGRECHDPRERA
jgi:hypothetical protein